MPSAPAVIVPDVYTITVHKYQNANPSIRWANTYDIKARVPGTVPIPADTFVGLIETFETSYHFLDCTIDTIVCRQKQYGKNPLVPDLPLWTKPVGLPGNNQTAPIGAVAPNPVGGEVVVRLKKTHTDGSRARYNFYRNATDKNSVVATPGGPWVAAGASYPSAATTAALLGTTLDLLLDSAPSPNAFNLCLVHAHFNKVTVTWTILGITFVLTISWANVSTNKRNRKNPR